MLFIKFVFIFHFSKSSFAKNKYRFSVYITAQHKIEDSHIPDDDEDSILDGQE